MISTTEEAVEGISDRSATTTASTCGITGAIAVTGATFARLLSIPVLALEAVGELALTLRPTIAVGRLGSFSGLAGALALPLSALSGLILSWLAFGLRLGLLRLRVPGLLTGLLARLFARLRRLVACLLLFGGL